MVLSDKQVFEESSKRLIGIERLMLEASSFDFTVRLPHKTLIRYLKACNLQNEDIGRTAYNMCLDLYRTFAPLKQKSSTLAMACTELALRLHDGSIDRLKPALYDEEGLPKRGRATRGEIMGRSRLIVHLDRGY